MTDELRRRSANHKETPRHPFIRPLRPHYRTTGATWRKHRDTCGNVLQHGTQRVRVRRCRSVPARARRGSDATRRNPAKFAIKVRHTCLHVDVYLQSPIELQPAVDSRGNSSPRGTKHTQVVQHGETSSDRLHWGSAATQVVHVESTWKHTRRLTRRSTSDIGS